MLIEDVIARVQTEDENNDRGVASQSQAGQVASRGNQRLVETVPFDPATCGSRLRQGALGGTAASTLDQPGPENQKQSAILRQERAADPAQMRPTAAGGTQRHEERLGKIALVKETDHPDGGHQPQTRNCPEDDSLVLAFEQKNVEPDQAKTQYEIRLGQETQN